MDFVTTYLPFLSSLISFVFAYFVLKRYAEKKGAHTLLWGIGMIFYGIGGFCEGYYGFFGWNDLVFRLWYLFGAILVAAWLGQGTVYLLAKKPWPQITLGLLILGSLWGVYKVFTAQLDPSLLTTSLQHLRHGDPGRRCDLVCLDLLPQARPAPPYAWQHSDRCWRVGPRFWRCRQPLWHPRRAVYRRTGRRDPDVHRFLAGNHPNDRKTT